MSLIPARPLLSVALCPDQVGLVWRAGRTGRSEHLIPCAATVGERPWQGPLDVLGQWLATAKLVRARVRVVLSNRFVRHALVPWPQAPLHGEENKAWERLHLETAYGPSDGWCLTGDPGAYGCAHVVCAAPQDLLDRLHGLLADQRLVTGPVVPYFVQAWNHWHRKLAAGQLFVVAESDRVVLGLRGRSGWESLRMVSSALAHDKLVALVQRERMLSGASDTLPVMLYAPGLRRERSEFAADRGVEWLGSDTADEGPALHMARLAEQP